MTSKLIVASAGSGKTTSIVREAIQKSRTGQVLITTYTEANAEGVRKKLIEENGCIPKNIVVQTWFSFLLQHGVRPYQGSIKIDKDMWNFNIRECVFPDSDSSIVRGRNSIFSKSQSSFFYYFASDGRIFTDKLAKFAIECNISNQVINRLSTIYPCILIDEIQDFAGYDLDFIDLLIRSPISLTMVGDPRQATYRTSNVQKNSKYTGGKIELFISEKGLSDLVKIDNISKKCNYRCSKPICDFSNLLFPAPWPQAESLTKADARIVHQGIFLIRSDDIERYIATYNPTQLRWNKRKAVSNNASVYNLGESKGLEFDRVLIYPTEPFLGWLRDHSSNLSDEARAKFYVGLTRAKFSVGIVCDIDVANIERWTP